MNDYLTYEEIMISSLIGVSGYTIYLNDGSRYNRGVLKLSDDIQYEGIQLGLVGARFERQGRMDTLYVLDEAPHAQSFPFASYFAGETFEARYKSRIRITVETMLLEAQQRGLEEGKAVYVHVVGLGLGVWAVHEDQPQWYIEVFTKCLAALDVSRIDVLEFAWIDVDDTTEEDLEAVASKKGITCLFSRANPSKKLADDSLLLVTTYAWDGNAYPGNEYYLGQLTASGDPAAACSTTIAETHNPEINTEMLKSIHYFKL
ncbi:hypothetical protein ANO11243_052680 [Dothideomycetidae sp. 11243]|nr:hypothetical protein ANO11243_052680 [fungal sp. No.11243]